MKKIWITWENQRRTMELARLLHDVTLFLFDLDAPRSIRYPYLLLRTLYVLIYHRPQLVFVQNPSVVLSFFTIVISKVMKFHVVVDAHNEGLKPFHSRHNWLLPIYKWIQRSAALTIVTNIQLSKEVSLNGGTPFVLEDRIPQMKPNARTSLKGNQNIVFVCTFEKDEPYSEVIAGARFLDPSICIYITGRYQKAPPSIIKEAPRNIIFCGFLPEQEYANLLYSCDAVLDLTLMQNCLVCGAYEAVALGKPLILSDTYALRNYFYKGAIYTENSAHSIANSICQAIDNRENLEKEVRELRNELNTNWQQKYEELIFLLTRMSNV